MARVTSKLQVTVPKAIAERLEISPGDDITWSVEGASARVTRQRALPERPLAERLAIFDEATARQDTRNRAWRREGHAKTPAGRGWTRAELYTRGRAR